MQKTFRFLKWSGKKAVVLAVLTVCLAAIVLGTTLAFIIVRTNSIKNQFDPPNLIINIEGNNIQNTGDVPVYVRAVVVANWVNTQDGSILSVEPKSGDDYTIDIDTENWFMGSDGFYYYKAPLEAGTTAPQLASYATPKTQKDGYELRVQLVASGIQTTPATAVETAWPAVVVDDNNNLTANANSR